MQLVAGLCLLLALLFSLAHGQGATGFCLQTSEETVYNVDMFLFHPPSL